MAVSRTVIWAMVIEAAVGLVAAGVVVGVLYYFSILDGTDVTSSPTEVTSSLGNPLTGWCPFGNLVQPMPQPFTMVAVFIRWRDIEPSQGDFRWDELEGRYQFERWTLGKKKFVFRVVMDLPQGYSHIDIPDWLLQATNREGRFYNDPTVGQGYSPNYANAALVAAHEALINAIAQKYGNDTRVMVIQIGSLGHNGEWTTKPETFPTNDVTDLYLQHYIKAFPNKILQMPRPVTAGLQYSIGLFYSSIGNASGVAAFNRMFTGPTYTDEAGQEQTTNPNFHQGAPVSGNLMDSTYSKYFSTANLSETINQAKQIYLSFLGPNCPADQALDGPLQENYDAFTSAIGYRFVIERVTFFNAAAQGRSYEFKVVVTNKGCGRFYLDWPLEVSLCDSGNVIYRMNSKESIKSWGPGTKTAELAVDIPDTAALRKFTLCLAIIDPSDNTPGVKFAIAGMQPNGRYCFGELRIVKGGFLLRDIIIIGVGIAVGTLIIVGVTYLVGKCQVQGASTMKVTPDPPPKSVEQASSQPEEPVVVDLPTESEVKRGARLHSDAPLRTPSRGDTPVDSQRSPDLARYAVPEPIYHPRPYPNKALGSNFKAASRSVHVPDPEFDPEPDPMPAPSSSRSPALVVAPARRPEPPPEPPLEPDSQTPTLAVRKPTRKLRFIN